MTTERTKIPCPVESPLNERRFSWSCERQRYHGLPHGTPETHSSDRDWLSGDEWVPEQKLRKKGQKPKPLTLHNAGGLGFTDEAKISYLAPRHRGQPHVMIDLRDTQGVLELGVVNTRRLHRWLGRFLDYRDSRQPVKTTAKEELDELVEESE